MRNDFFSFVASLFFSLPFSQTMNWMQLRRLLLFSFNGKWMFAVQIVKMSADDFQCVYIFSQKPQTHSQRHSTIRQFGILCFRINIFRSFFSTVDHFHLIFRLFSHTKPKPEIFIISRRIKGFNYGQMSVHTFRRQSCDRKKRNQRRKKWEKLTQKTNSI